MKRTGRRTTRGGVFKATRAAVPDNLPTTRNMCARNNGMCARIKYGCGKSRKINGSCFAKRSSVLRDGWTHAPAALRTTPREIHDAGAPLRDYKQDYRLPHSCQPSRFGRDTHDISGLVPVPPDRALQQMFVPTNATCDIEHECLSRLTPLAT